MDVRWKSKLAVIVSLITGLVPAAGCADGPSTEGQARADATGRPRDLFKHPGTVIDIIPSQNAIAEVEEWVVYWAPEGLTYAGMRGGAKNIIYVMRTEQRGNDLVITQQAISQGMLGYDAVDIAQTLADDSRAYYGDTALTTGASKPAIDTGAAPNSARPENTIRLQNAATASCEQLARQASVSGTMGIVAGAFTVVAGAACVLATGGLGTFFCYAAGAGVLVTVGSNQSNIDATTAGACSEKHPDVR